MKTKKPNPELVLKQIDEVLVPRVRSGRNSYRNLVSACVECNSRKGMTRAEDFLRSLYRKRRLTDAELNGRLRAIDASPQASSALPLLPPLHHLLVSASLCRKVNTPFATVPHKAECVSYHRR